jgi:hypothetical protein
VAFVHVVAGGDRRVLGAQHLPVLGVALQRHPGRRLLEADDREDLARDLEYGGLRPEGVRQIGTRLPLAGRERGSSLAAHRPIRAR